MATPVRMPSLGQTSDELRLLTWLKAEGDTVGEGEPLLEIETDKTTLEIEASTSGTLLRILCGEGETVGAGALLGWLGEPNEAIPGEDAPAAGEQPPPAESAPPPAAAGPLAAEETRARVLATPAARTRAKELGVDIAGVSGSGPSGRVERRDVEALGSAWTTGQQAPSTAAPDPLDPSRSLSRTDLLRRVGRLEQLAGVRLVTLGDGGERGVRVLEFRSGTGFEFDVLVDRGFDIGRCSQEGRPLAWISPTGFPGPWFAEAGGLGFLRGFGAGLLTTCGLDHAFGPAEDTAEQYHYPAKPTESYGLHGRASGTPARLVAYGEEWRGDECVLFAEGEVVQSAVFGEHLVLRRRIEVRVGESRILIRDQVANAGFDPTTHMLLYHVNIGWPVVDEGSELLAPASSVRARGAYPTDGYSRFHGPTAGYVEQVFEHDLAAGTDGRVPVAIVNRTLGLGAYQLFRQSELPHHFVWRMLGEGTYVVGIEPSTNRPAGRLDARERGELIELRPGEHRSYELELGALVGAAAIDRFAATVAALGGDGSL